MEFYSLLTAFITKNQTNWKNLINSHAFLDNRFPPDCKIALQKSVATPAQNDA